MLRGYLALATCINKFILCVTQRGSDFLNYAAEYFGVEKPCWLDTHLVEKYILDQNSLVLGTVVEKNIGTLT